MTLRDYRVTYRLSTGRVESVYAVGHTLTEVIDLFDEDSIISIRMCEKKPYRTITKIVPKPVSSKVKVGQVLVDIPFVVTGVRMTGNWVYDIELQGWTKEPCNISKFRECDHVRLQLVKEYDKSSEPIFFS